MELLSSTSGTAKAGLQLGPCPVKDRSGRARGPVDVVRTSRRKAAAAAQSLPIASGWDWEPREPDRPGFSR